MHSDETWQLFSKNGEPIAGAGWPAAKDNPKEGDKAIVGIAVVFLHRLNKDGEHEFLWQRRSEKVSRYPGDWDLSAGGHINLGESPLEAAVREAHEEIGAEIEPSWLELVVAMPMRGKMLWTYCVDWTNRLEEFCFDDEEVQEVRWIKYSMMDDFRNQYAKQPLKGDTATFTSLDSWLFERRIQ